MYKVIDYNETVKHTHYILNVNVLVCQDGQAGSIGSNMVLSVKVTSPCLSTRTTVLVLHREHVPSNTHPCTCTLGHKATKYLVP